MEKKDLLNTREVAKLLDINEKMVYTLISEKGLPATKATGKWLFPRHLVEQWVENRTINYPKVESPIPAGQSMLILSGSNDILLDRAISLFNRLHPETVAVFGNNGSQGGIQSLRRGLCHLACSHLVQENEEEYNFGFAKHALGQFPVVINFCKREQGLILAKGNPKGIKSVSDLEKRGLKVVNRSLGTGTRLLFQKQIQKRGLQEEKINGFQNEEACHLDVGLAVLSGRADAGPGIRAVASLLGLDFLSWGWERFDFLALKERFFDKGVQLFLGLLHEPAFQTLVKDLPGYDLSLCGKMVYPQEAEDFT